jgi:hypothetical protein
MADKYLVAGSVDLSASASWAATIDGAGGDGTPGAGDDVFIMEGSQTINVGLTQLNSNDLGSVTIGAAFTGSLGTAATSATIQCQSGEVNISARGAQVHITAGTGNLATVNIETSGGATVRLAGGTTATVNLRGGILSIENGATVTTLNQSSGSVTAIAGTTFTTTRVTGGALSSERALGTATVDGSAQVTTTEAATVTTLNVHGSSMVNHRSSGTITTANLYGGTLTPAGARQAATITTANRYGGSIVTKTGLTEFSIGTNNDILGGEQIIQASGYSPQTFNPA